MAFQPNIYKGIIKGIGSTTNAGIVSVVNYIELDGDRTLGPLVVKDLMLTKLRAAMESSEEVELHNGVFWMGNSLLVLKVGDKTYVNGSVGPRPGFDMFALSFAIGGIATAIIVIGIPFLYAAWIMHRGVKRDKKIQAYVLGMPNMIVA